MVLTLCWAETWPHLYTSSAAHEVVEVDGFVFKRKRSIPEPTANTTEQDQPASKRPKLPDSTSDAQVSLPRESNTPAPAAATAAESAAEGNVAVDIATVKTPDAKAVSAATTALLEQLPADMSEPDRLASLCELLCAAEMDELSTSSVQEQQLDPAVVDTVRQALDTFVRAVQSSAAAGDFQVCVCVFVYVCVRVCVCVLLVMESVLEPVYMQRIRPEQMCCIMQCQL